MQLSTRMGSPWVVAVCPKSLQASPFARVYGHTAESYDKYYLRHGHTCTQLVSPSATPQPSPGPSSVSARANDSSPPSNTKSLRACVNTPGALPTKADEHMQRCTHAPVPSASRTLWTHQARFCMHVVMGHAWDYVMHMQHR